MKRTMKEAPEIVRRRKRLERSLHMQYLHPDRTRTIRALVDVLGSIPDNVVFPKFSVYAPSHTHMGNLIARMPRVPIVHLSGNAEYDSIPRLRYLIAHEFAHLILKHHELPRGHRAHEGMTHEKKPVEIAAVKLAAKWGFHKPRGFYAITNMIECYEKHHSRLPA